MYALYILFKLLLRHLLPVVLVLLCLLRPRYSDPNKLLIQKLICFPGLLQQSESP